MVKCFSVRFQNISDFYDPRTADVVIDSNLRKEFFDLVAAFGLNAIYTANDVWHIQPGENTDPEELALNVSPWDMFFHKYMEAGKRFEEKNRAFHIKEPTVVIPDKYWFA